MPSGQNTTRHRRDQREADEDGNQARRADDPTVTHAPLRRLQRLSTATPIFARSRPARAGTQTSTDRRARSRRHGHSHRARRPAGHLIPNYPRSGDRLTLHLGIVAGYSPRVDGARPVDWPPRPRHAQTFVAGRSLGPGLIFSTMLAANIGAEFDSRCRIHCVCDGKAPGWWVGSVAVGCFVLAMWVGPRIRRIAAAENLRGWRLPRISLHDRTCRAVFHCAAVGSARCSSLASQLIGLGLDPERRGRRAPSAVGCAIGGVVITVYFAAGGLLTSAWVNVVQLAA